MKAIITLAVFDTATEKEIWRQTPLPIEAFDLGTIAFSLDNQLLAICGTQWNCAQGGNAASTLMVVDGDTGATKYIDKQGGIHAAFSPDGTMLAAFEEKMQVFDDGSVANGEVDASSILWPEGKRLRFGQRMVRYDSWINLLDPKTGESLGKITHPDMGGVWLNYAQHIVRVSRSRPGDRKDGAPRVNARGSRSWSLLRLGESPTWPYSCRGWRPLGRPPGPAVRMG